MRLSSCSLRFFSIKMNEQCSSNQGHKHIAYFSIKLALNNLKKLLSLKVFAVKLFAFQTLELNCRVNPILYPSALVFELAVHRLCGIVEAPLLVKLQSGFIRILIISQNRKTREECQRKFQEVLNQDGQQQLKTTKRVQEENRKVRALLQKEHSMAREFIRDMKHLCEFHQAKQLQQQ